MRWALDSGAYTELTLHGRWTFTPGAYVRAVRRYTVQIGGLDWAAPMDWPCDRDSLARTGLSVAEHQRHTVENLLVLRQLAPEVHFIPVLQGASLSDFTRCLTHYQHAGVDLASEPLVGVGSLVSRQGTAEVSHIIRSLAEMGLALHAFGLHGPALASHHDQIASADSMAWSRQARYSLPLPGCRHARCNNCWRYAIRWRSQQLPARRR